jgi:hypothetical protein
MQILGHSQISLTLGTYGHVMPELAQDAADRAPRPCGAPNDVTGYHAGTIQTTDGSCSGTYLQVTGSGPRGTRTHNLRIKSPQLCLLS